MEKEIVWSLLRTTKEFFISKPAITIMSPARNELGRISKFISDKIN